MCCRVSYTWQHDFPKLAKEAGFCFSDPTLPGCFDWSAIGVLDVDRIYRERDFASLEHSLGYILEGPLNSLLASHVLDPAIGKLFRVSQLAVQYLLFCKQFLDRSVTVMRNSLNERHKEIVGLKKLVKSRDEQIFKLRQRYNNERDLAGNPISIHTLASQLSNQLMSTLSCHICGKNFLHAIYLQAHMQRRHSSEEQPVRDPGPSSGNLPSKVTNVGDVRSSAGVTRFTQSEGALKDVQLIDSIKLQLEIKQLKERLSSTERILEQVSSGNVHDSSVNLIRLGEPSTRNVSVNTEEEPIDVKETISGRDRDIEALRRQFGRSIDDMRNQALLMEVSRKMDMQEELWKRRCESLEIKLEEETATLLQALNQILSSKKRPPVSVESSKETIVTRLVDSKDSGDSFGRDEMKITDAMQQKLTPKKSSLRADRRAVVNRDSSSSFVKPAVELSILKKPAFDSRPKDYDNPTPRTSLMRTLARPQSAGKKSSIPIIKSSKSSNNEAVEDHAVPLRHVRKVTDFTMETEAEIYIAGKHDSQDNDLIEEEFSESEDLDMEEEFENARIKVGDKLDKTDRQTNNPEDEMMTLAEANRENAAALGGTSESTVQLRSITSLPEVLSKNPEQMEKYRNSMQKDLDERLWKLNIDPKSDQLLEHNFMSSMRILAHQRKLKAKKLAKGGIDLEEIRADIVKHLDMRLQTTTNDIEDLKTTEMESPHHKPNIRTSAMTKQSPAHQSSSLFGLARVKSAMTKSMEILPNLLRGNDIKKSPQKEAMTEGKQVTSTIVLTASPQVDERGDSPKKKKMTKAYVEDYEEDTMYELADSETSSNDSLDDFEFNIAKPSTSTSLERLLASPIKKPEPYIFTSLRGNPASPSITSDSFQPENLEKRSITREIKENITTAQIKGQLPSKNTETLKTKFLPHKRFEKPLVISSRQGPQSPILNNEQKPPAGINKFLQAKEIQSSIPIDPMSPIIQFETQTSARQYDDHKGIQLQQSTSQQSMYTTISTDSDLSEEINDFKIPVQTSTRANQMPSNNVLTTDDYDLALDILNSQDDVDNKVVFPLMMDNKKKKHVIFNLDANTHKTLSSAGASPVQEDDSDYNLSSIESIVTDFPIDDAIAGMGPKTVEQSTQEPLLLSTKQSPRIAEIAKEIQGRIRVLPRIPAGGIMAGIASQQISHDQQLEVIGSRDIKSKEDSSRPTPKPRAKTDLPNVLDDLTLSDFSF